jgi:xylose isomerase
VVEYKHKIGFKGAILIEPKPQEPSKHQYDYDVATVYGFLKDFGLEKEVKTNIEQGHAILAGHSFEHEIALAASLGIFGSIDMNRNDYQSGWDTDQFPNNHAEKAVAFYEILKAGGFTTGGTNFDAKIRRQSLDPEDLILAHVGGMDTCARALKCGRRADGKRRDGSRPQGPLRRLGTPKAKAMLKGSLDQAAARPPSRPSGKGWNRSPSAALLLPLPVRPGKSGWRTCGTATSD